MEPGGGLLGSLRRIGEPVMGAASEIGFDVRPEHALLLRCIRAHFGTAEPPPRAMFDAIDVDVLMAEATDHGLIPLVNRQLEHVSGVPQALQQTFKAEAQRIVASNLLLGRELAAIAEDFSTAGVRALAFKGPTQALQAYGDLGFRPFNDLDVLVRWEGVEPALRVLADRGYDLPASVASRARMHEYEYHVPCYHPTTGVLIEMHWHPVSNRFALRLDEEGYWMRAGTVAIAGQQVPAMGREDTLLITCAHATKHQWERLEWAVSVAAQTVSPEKLDWDRALHLAEEGGIRRVLLTGLALAQVLSGVALPEKVRGVVRADRRAQRLASRVLRTTLGRRRAESPSAAEPFRAVGFHLLVRDELGDGLRYLLAPKTSDREVVIADDAPLPVVVGARMYRLLKRHLATQRDEIAAKLRRWGRRQP